MKKEILKTLAWVITGILWTGAHQLAVYLIEMQYSAKVAPNQVDDDNAYTLMKTHAPLMSAINLIYFVGFLVIAGFVAVIWLRKMKPVVLKSDD